MAEATGSGLAVVTGASSGIGFELARQFAEHGFDLIVVAEEEGIVGAADERRGPPSGGVSGPVCGCLFCCGRPSPALGMWTDCGNGSGRAGVPWRGSPSTPAWVS